MLAALRAPQTRAGGIRMIPALLKVVPRAAAIAIGGLVLTGGAIGASAAVGGPSVPAALLTAVGLHSEEHESGIGHSNASETGKEHANDRAFLGAGNGQRHKPAVTPTATATATSTATPAGTATAAAAAASPPHAGAKGLCNALTRGSENGQANKARATAFERLAEDPDACATATATPAATATATVTGTATSAGSAGAKGLCNALTRGSENGRANKAEASAFERLAEKEDGCAEPSATATPTASTSGSSNTQQATPGGNEQANLNALLGLGLDVDDAPNVTPNSGIGNAPDAAQNGKGHANGRANAGAGNANNPHP
jgi:hypothetical protein